MVVGFLWAVKFVVISSPETEWTGICGGALFFAVGIVRLVLQVRARRNANKALTQQPPRREVDRFMKLEHHGVSSRPATGGCG